MSSNNNINKSLKKLLMEKYANEGFDAFTEKELIQLILTYSSCKDCSGLSDKLIAQYGSLNALIDADLNTLTEKYGINEQTAVMLRLIPRLSRIYFMGSSEITVFDSSRNAIKYFENYFIGALKEKLAAVCTNERFRIIACKTVFVGSVSAVNISCREIADFCLKNNSTKVFIAHNHPIGSASPSGSDCAATDMVFRTLEKLGITLIDHIIVGKHSAISMRELPYTLQFKNADACGYDLNYKP